MIVDRYQRRIMNNVERGDYVECMIACALGAEWQLTSIDWDWAAWDCEHVASGARLEIKQSAARQSWDGETVPTRRPSFDIAPRKGFWPRSGNDWINFSNPCRLADIYVFAWHGVTDRHADQRDVAQWRFFVVSEQQLNPKQKSIALGSVEKIGTACSFARLRSAVEGAFPAHEMLKSSRIELVAGH